MAPDAQAAGGGPSQSSAVDVHGTQKTIAILTDALDTDPLNNGLHAALADVLRDAGDEAGYLAHRIAVETANLISATAADAGASVEAIAEIRSALPLFNLATAFYIRGNYPSAARWFEHTLAIEPDLAIAHQNFAAVLDMLERPDDAQQHRSRAYSLQRVFVEAAEHATHRVLILCAGRTSGNVPFDTLLPASRSYRIKYAIDCASEVEDLQLPCYDLVFNAIGEPDVAQPLLNRVEMFARRSGRPLLNRPAAIMQTQRNRLPALLADIDDVLIPPCMRIDRALLSRDELAAQLDEGRIGFPLLLRPLAKHGGEGVSLHQSLDTLWPAVQALNAPCYLTMFRNTCGADGYFRKYRSIFVDRRPFPYHLAIASQWMVHYFSADMTAHPWKLDEERRFLDDPRTALGERATRALAAIGERLDLDYAGIDFTLLDDGRVLVFEANATMLVHREVTDGVFAHKNAHVERIVDAFEQMQAARLRKQP
ncbi:glutathione synthase/RimK-type ligase-like ATP-grasp enzyme [Paraburkholderia rhizosphaerae]|uniref:Glutathione synthase/RimK-type ligase-like ATP-grasp enzyme n=2 Tax=Paraburkholderia rhizosphaerae TaxID=480658 RepID=A0A4R8M201_9BURK|nr:glutathione synthase/RimK-type ligase-like ATP-grasp enzyme [Paraburkholderia rhizosphaerae]